MLTVLSTLLVCATVVLCVHLVTVRGVKVQITHNKNYTENIQTAEPSKIGFSQTADEKVAEQVAQKQAAAFDNLLSGVNHIMFGVTDPSDDTQGGKVNG
jgi:hypothetical protein